MKEAIKGVGVFKMNTKILASKSISEVDTSWSTCVNTQEKYELVESEETSLD